jgi:hypothetical protein
MDLTIKLCELCYEEGKNSLATHGYTDSNLNYYEVCDHHKKMIESTDLKDTLCEVEQEYPEEELISVLKEIVENHSNQS